MATPDSDVFHAAFTHGATVAFAWCSGMLLIGAFVAVVFNRIRHQDLGNADHGKEPSGTLPH